MRHHDNSFCVLPEHNGYVYIPRTRGCLYATALGLIYRWSLIKMIDRKANIYALFRSLGRTWCDLSYNEQSRYNLISRGGKCCMEIGEKQIHVQEYCKTLTYIRYESKS